MRIAVDAMGGDFAPAEPVKGALAACRQDPLIEVILVGIRDQVSRVLDEVGGSDARVRILHASEVVRADENPLQALRRKDDTSIAAMVGLVKSGEADAMVSAGNTGATVASAVFSLKLLDGIRRAGIATFLPTVNGRAVVIDVGANLRCKPEHLLQYGVMGSVFTRLILGKERPTIGLLNIGQEDAKGNDLVKETHLLFSEAPVNYRGNLEGHDVFMGAADVLVCEGFVGNVVLKVSEGLAETIMVLLANGYGGDALRTDAERGILKKSLEWLKERTDYREYGGAPLLGVNGACVIGHGRSDARAVTNAVAAAAKFAELRVNERIVEELQRVTSAQC